MLLAVLLACALWSTGYTNTDGDRNTKTQKGPSVNTTFPALCLFQSTAMNGYNYNGGYVVLVLMFLAVSYLTRILQLFKDLPKFKIPFYSRT